MTPETSQAELPKKKEDSAWVKNRDAVENTVAHWWHAYAMPVFAKATAVALPALKQAAVTTALDIAKANGAGTIHGSNDMISVARSSLEKQLPTLGATMTTSFASALVEHAAQGAANDADAELSTPPKAA